MKVVPLAAESLGVRSMATYVECGGMRLLLDPGATLAPSRQNLPPAAEEWEALRRANDRISAYGARADVVFVSHYHEDHFRSDPAAYAGRIVVAKDPRRMIAGQQARRAAALWSGWDRWPTWSRATAGAGPSPTWSCGCRRPSRTESRGRPSARCWP
jgi:predicted metallo-beta-lactamase superfamily hydrolase